SAPAGAELRGVLVREHRTRLRRAPRAHAGRAATGGRAPLRSARLALALRHGRAEKTRVAPGDWSIHAFPRLARARCARPSARARGPDPRDEGQPARWLDAALDLRRRPGRR